jgi:hypothetical protein
MASAPHLPVFAGGAPHGFEMREQRALKLPRGREVLETAHPRMVKRIYHFAEDIELELVDGGVADAHWFEFSYPPSHGTSRSASPRPRLVEYPMFISAKRVSVA